MADRVEQRTREAMPLSPGDVEAGQGPGAHHKCDGALPWVLLEPLQREEDVLPVLRGMAR